MTNMKTVATGDAPSAIGPYSQAIVLGDLVFVSGQLPMQANGEIVAGGVEEQTKKSIENLQNILSAAGASLNSVVKTTVFVKDLKDFPLINAVYESCFGLHRPARSTVEVARLPKDALVEIEAIGYVK